MPEACNSTEKEALPQVFSYEFCGIFIKTSFYRTPLVVAFAFSEILSISNFRYAANTFEPVQNLNSVFAE